MPPDTKVVTGVAALVEHEDKLLMLQRGGKQWYADGFGTWSVPGGWLEAGEYPSQAAEREVMEETGVSVRFTDHAGITTNWNRETSLWVATIFTRCEYLSGLPVVSEPDKCPVVEWVPLEEVKNLDLFTPLHLWRHTYLAA